MAEEFRKISALLAVKTGASVFPVEYPLDAIYKEASLSTFDDLLTRLFATAVALGIWEKP